MMSSNCSSAALTTNCSESILVAKLRVGILTEQPHLPHWTKTLVERIQSDPTVSLKVFYIDRGNSSELSENREGLLYRWYQLLDRKRGRIVKQEIALEALDANFERLMHTPLAACDLEIRRHLASYQFDLILSLDESGSCDEYAGLSKFGVWYFHYGDLARRRSAHSGFWEVFEGKPTSTASLLLKRESDGPVYCLLKTSFRTHPTSPTINQNRLRQGAVSLWHWGVRSLQTNNPTTEEFFLHLPILDGKGEELPAKPHPLEMLYFVASNIVKIIKGKTLQRNKTPQWSIGITKEELLSLRTSNFENIRWFHPDRTRFLADPFLVEEKDKLWIFVEDFNYRTHKGHIAIVEFRRDAGFSEVRPVLEQNFHLSFPFVFRYGQKFYMLPEQATTNQIMLYRAENFPEGWQPDRVLIQDFPGVDNILFQHNNRWWLFTSYGRDGSHDNNLHLFYSDDLHGVFHPHPKNPVKLGLRGSRMAGNLFFHDRTIYRPAQNCSLRYGGSVVLYEIIKLSETEYEEREIREIKPPLNSAFSEGFHTVNSLGEYTAVAGFRYISRAQRRKPA